jgi:hypothetical protein
MFETPERETPVQTKESSRSYEACSYKVINDFLQAIMLALFIALMVSGAAMVLSAIVDLLER